MSRASHAHHDHSHAHEEHDHPGLSVTVEKQTGKAEVAVTIAAAELDKARGREFAALSRRVTMKGFRPGKTPRAMLVKNFGGEVEKSILEHFLQHAYQQAVEEHGLRPAAFPRIPLSENLPKPGEDWSIRFHILLRPEVTLGQIDGLEVESRSVEVGDEELERALVEIRRANSRAEPAGDEGLAADGMAVATLDFFRPGETESCLTRAGIRLVPGTPPQGADPRTFEQALIGARVGDLRSMEWEFPPNFPIEEARGQRGSVRFSIQEVMRIVPPTDAELFKAFESSDEAGLRVALRQRMQTGKQEAEEQRQETELLERLIAEHPMQLPAELVDDQVQAQQVELIAELEKQGLGKEEAAKRAESEQARARATTEKALKAVYLIEEVARVKELKVTQEDVSAELSSIAERNGTTPAEVANYDKDQGLLRQLGLELLERKVRRYLRASAAIRMPS